MDSTTRFSDRVDDYVRYRPTYPRQIVPYLHEALGVDGHASVADIGSGTGIFTELLLDAGHFVYAVEPNAPMRHAAERALGNLAGFLSLAGTAEQTMLADASVDLVTAAQAFHWFDVEAAAREFRRILRPGGGIALIWNDRREDASAFAREYQALIDDYNIDLATVDHRRITRDTLSAVESLFGADGYTVRTFPNEQRLDFDGLRGRLVSSSYIPGPGAPRHDEMIAALRELFETHAVDGTIAIEYDTRVYCGTIGGGSREDRSGKKGGAA